MHEFIHHLSDKHWDSTNKQTLGFHQQTCARIYHLNYRNDLWMLMVKPDGPRLDMLGRCMFRAGFGALMN